MRGVCSDTPADPYVKEERNKFKGDTTAMH